MRKEKKKSKATNGGELSAHESLVYALPNSMSGDGGRVLPQP